MRIPSYEKIEKQVDDYIYKKYSFDIMFPAYRDLDLKLSSIHKKYEYIRDYCEKNRNKDDHTSCICKTHPDYARYVEETTPIEYEVEKMRLQWRTLISKEKKLYESMLLKARKAKLDYLD